MFQRTPSCTISRPPGTKSADDVAIHRCPKVFQTIRNCALQASTGRCCSTAAPSPVTTAADHRSCGMILLAVADRFGSKIGAEFDRVCDWAPLIDCTVV